MKKRTKVLALLACAVMLVVGSIMGTIAYLSTEKTITNTFTVGKVTFGDENGDGALDEALVNEYGRPIDANGDEVALVNAVRTSSNAYKLIPGHTYVKDPTIHIGEESESCYLFVKVVNGISSIEATTAASYKTIVDQMKADDTWDELTANNAANVYVYNTKVTGKAKGEGVLDIVIFDEFKIKDNATAAELEACKDSTIVITAYAVQADGFTTAVEAWNNTFGKSNQ